MTSPYHRTVETTDLLLEAFTDEQVWEKCGAVCREGRWLPAWDCRPHSQTGVAGSDGPGKERLKAQVVAALASTRDW